MKSIIFKKLSCYGFNLSRLSAFSTSGINSGISSPNRWNLVGKNIVVTGGSKGIGRACVEEMSKMGASILTCARSKSEMLTCENEWRSQGFNTHSCIADISTENGKKILLVEIDKTFHGRVDCLVNNVGANIRKKAAEYSMEEYEKIMDTNLKSTFSLTLALYPHLKNARNGGSVVNIGSVAGNKTFLCVCFFM
jgi:tropinone reductase I